MRALGIALAVLAMSLTSGGVAYQPSADVSSASGAIPSTDLDLGQCRAEQPTLTVFQLPKLVECRAATVRPLSGAGFNYLPDDRWHPERGVAPPPAAARR